MQAPRIILAGLSGGSGKTLVSLGLCRAWAKDGRLVKPFKKGPDYIDAAWLALAAGRETTNLDPFFMTPDQIRALARERFQGAEAAVVEGNRGLFDGLDVSGSCSTAELARILEAPVVLVMDCTKTTRTAAALVKGVRDFESGLDLAGVVLNRTASDRHRAILTDSIQTLAEVPVLGALPRLPKDPIPERHMGLVGDLEHGDSQATLDELADMVRRHLDLDALWRIAAAAPPLPESAATLWPEPVKGGRPVIGVVRDAALWFYYPENITALEKAGAEIVELSILDPAPWPDINGLYLGGGFPETQARALAENAAIREHVRALAERGLPIYAECGGFMYLCRELVVNDQTYPMADVFPISCVLDRKPRGLGYTEAEAVAPNPFHPPGTRLKGHEFHYSHCRLHDRPLPGPVLKIIRGKGVAAGRDGLTTHNTYAGYNHIHTLAAPHWAPNFVKAALER